MISCGDVITTTTATGTSYYNVDHYNAWQNDPMRGSDYEGQEHAFYFYHPGSTGYDYTRAEITLETPCTDMDLLYFLTPDGSPSCYNEFSYSSILYSNGASANNGIQSETVLLMITIPIYTTLLWKLEMLFQVRFVLQLLAM